MLRLVALAGFVLCAACAGNAVVGTDAGNSSGGGAGGSGGSGGAGGGAGYTADSFFTQCNGVSTVLTGTAFAPNGTDPVAAAEISVFASAPAALARGVSCENCNTPVAAGVLLTTVAGVNGVFSLSLDTLPKAASYVVTVRKARFRRVLSPLAITACGPNALTTAQTTLPGSSAQGDVPKIAIASGNRDHLEKVVTAMGITEFDCVKGLPPGGAGETCTSTRTLGQLLADPTLLAGYGLLFIACAPADTYQPASGTASAAVNLKNWVALGGKLVVTDDSYDFVEQIFPDAIEFAGTAGAAGVAQPLNTGEVGTAMASMTATVSDSTLAAWLKLFPGAISASNTVSVQGFLSSWAVQKKAGAMTSTIVHGTAQFSGGPADVPLTTRFEVSNCGRVVYSSYHTDTGTGLLPQERILEYLLFEVGTCVGIN